MALTKIAYVKIKQPNGAVSSKVPLTVDLDDPDIQEAVVDAVAEAGDNLAITAEQIKALVNNQV